ncbi:MAG: NUDIX hydrolase [Bacteroidales bacterium]|nr:NUDIX hydrolase [Bacteroidales bacterium]
MPYTYEYPRPVVTVDIIVFHRTNDNNLEILIIQRDNPPFEGKWAFPGGFVEIDESLDTAAYRELKEETGISKIKLEQLYTFGTLNRDPRHRTISVAYTGFVDEEEKQKAKAASDARSTGWFKVDQVPPLAFDHDEILKKALEFIDY